MHRKRKQLLESWRVWCGVGQFLIFFTRCKGTYSLKYYSPTVTEGKTFVQTSDSKKPGQKSDISLFGGLIETLISDCSDGDNNKVNCPLDTCCTSCDILKYTVTIL